MKKETRDLFRQVGMASTVGMSVAFAIFIGAGVGFWLDGRMGTFPWLTLVFLVMGVVAAFRNYFRFMKKQQRRGGEGS